jgi:hypothetical protein
VTAFLWKLRFALEMKRRSGVSLRDSWGCAEIAWGDNVGYKLDMTPSEAVHEELSCWTD